MCHCSDSLRTDLVLPYLALFQNTGGSNTADYDIATAAEDLRLPDPIEAVDGTLIYQSLIMQRFEVDLDEEYTLRYELHPSDREACAQYLVVARFVIFVMGLCRLCEH